MEHDFKHTPGPWRYGYTFSDEMVIGADLFDDLATVVIYLNGELVPEGIANTKLICAAPELLEALIDLVAQCEPLGDIENSSIYSEVQAAKAAIKKATT